MHESRFDFGRNWKAFSENALSEARVEQARRDFRALLVGIPLRDRSFLDIGFGQGLSLLLASAEGAVAVGCDINPLCTEVLRENQRRFFPELSAPTIPVIIGSILDDSVAVALRRKAADSGAGTYDIVHAWGVLHHTGDMKRAMGVAASLVRPGGNLVISIYARHWSSRAWRGIKYLYNRAPALLSLDLDFIPTFTRKWLVTRRNPIGQTRGMDFYYDIVDWVGGYPYEFAAAEEVIAFFQPLGFVLDRLMAATVPTGCNQFVFRRVS
jgi:2-polyprenyl-6-hydroxyphenyl methylase/3-demethylubiquinone-9 3-methyltransferase